VQKIYDFLSVKKQEICKKYFLHDRKECFPASHGLFAGADLKSHQEVVPHHRWFVRFFFKQQF
jgi:hypothetical protein